MIIIAISTAASAIILPVPADLPQAGAALHSLHMLASRWCMLPTLLLAVHGASLAESSSLLPARQLQDGVHWQTCAVKLTCRQQLGQISFKCVHVRVKAPPKLRGSYQWRESSSCVMKFAVQHGSAHLTSFKSSTAIPIPIPFPL